MESVFITEFDQNDGLSPHIYVYVSRFPVNCVVQGIVLFLLLAHLEHNSLIVPIRSVIRRNWK